jgi:hypothetical protein
MFVEAANLKIPARPGKNIFCLKQYAHFFSLRSSAVQPEKNEFLISIERLSALNF